jgi:beta-lactamase superfamily II metal-dependent hydrolase
MPDNHYMVHDAGNYTGGGSVTFKAIKELIPEGSTIDLMVLSHSESDHLGAVDEICDAYHVKRIIHSGYQRESQTWKDAAKAILLEKETDDCTDINLRTLSFHRVRHTDSGMSSSQWSLAGISHHQTGA